MSMKEVPTQTEILQRIILGYQSQTTRNSTGLPKRGNWRSKGTSASSVSTDITKIPRYRSIYKNRCEI